MGMWEKGRDYLAHCLDFTKLDSYFKELTVAGDLTAHFERWLLLVLENSHWIAVHWPWKRIIL